MFGASRVPPREERPPRCGGGLALGGTGDMPTMRTAAQCVLLSTPWVKCRPRSLLEVCRWACSWAVISPQVALCCADPQEFARGSPSRRRDGKIDVCDSHRLDQLFPLGSHADGMPSTARNGTPPARAMYLLVHGIRPRGAANARIRRTLAHLKCRIQMQLRSGIQRRITARNCWSHLNLACPGGGGGTALPPHRGRMPAQSPNRTAARSEAWPA